MNSTDLMYRKSAVEGASGLSLLIALYDTLAGDLRRAAEAERANDLERRNREANHALLIIGYLEDWIDRGSGGELAGQLVVFYASLRRELLEAQVRRSAQLIEFQMDRVLELRELWQQFELHEVHSGPEILPPAWKEQDSPPRTAAADRPKQSWSA